MKFIHKQIIPAFVVVASLSLSACGGSSSDKNSSDNSTALNPSFTTPYAQPLDPNARTTPSPFKVVGSAEQFFGNLSRDGGEVLVPAESSGTLTGLTLKAVALDSHPKKAELLAAIPAGAESDTVIENVIVLERSDNSAEVNDFAKAIEVTAAFDFSKLPADEAPIVLYYDEDTQSYSPVAIKNYDRVANTITFLTAHTSSYAILRVKNIFATIDSGFDPKLDSFLVPDLFNFGGNSGGNSYGIAAYVAWWFKQAQAKGNLSDLFEDESRPDDAYATQRLFNQLYKGSYNKASLQAAENIAEQIATHGRANTEAFVGKQLLQMLKATEQPQLFVMAAIDNICGDDPAVCDADQQEITATRTVVVYKYDINDKKFSFYDPNFPGEAVTIEWNEDDGFGDWSKSKSTNTQYNAYGFASSNTAFSTTTLNKLAAQADDALNEDPDDRIDEFEVKITGTDPVKTGQFTIDEDINDNQQVKIEGKVLVANATGQPRYVHLFIDGDLQPGSYVVDESNQTFTIAVGSLPNTSGTTFALYLTDNPVYWASGITNIAYNFKVRVQGQEFFKNLGFETGSLADVDGNSVWSSYQYSWNNIIPGNSSDPTPQGFVPGFDLENHATKPSSLSAVVDATNLQSTLGRLSSYNQSAVVGYDPIATDLQVPYYGNHAFRINNSNNGEPISTIIQQAIVPATSNPTINFRWAAVLEDPKHSPEQQPYVEVIVEDLDENDPDKKILYHAHFYSFDPAYPGWVTYDAYGNHIDSGNYSVGTPWHAIPWQEVNVSVGPERAGNRLKLTVTAASCHPSAHGGYAYLDAEE